MHRSTARTLCRFTHRAPTKLAALLMAEQARWGPVVRANGAKLEIGGTPLDQAA
jgi:hypothetical protein